MLDITIEVKDQGIQNFLKQAQEKLKDLTPLMRTISETMYEAVRENFDKEGRLDKWVGLSDATRAERMGISLKEFNGKTVKHKKGYKRKHKPTWPGKILQIHGVKGGLLGSISAAYDSNSAVVGSSMPFGEGYAAIHHFGGKAGRGGKATIPARPIFVLTDEDLGDVQQDAIDYLEK